LVNLGVGWLNPYLNSKFDLSWRDKQYTDDINSDQYCSSDYITADVKFWRNIGDNFTLALTVQNLFDDRHTLTPQGTQIIKNQEYSLQSFNPGRVFSASLNCKF